MMVIRRYMALLAVMAALWPLGDAAAKDWPAQAVRIVLPYPPGGASDVTARLLSTRLGEAWGVPVVIENRPGANGIVANEMAAKSPADGYTILMANLGPNAVNHAVYRKLPYDSVKDFAPVVLATVVPLVIVTSADSPIKDLKDLIARARADGGKLAYGSAGVGASSHMAGELLAEMAGVRFLHAPYKGDSPAIADLIGGQIAFALPTAPAAMSHLKSGRLRALAVTSRVRVATMPEVPTVEEALQLHDYEALSWGGFMVPAGTPPKVVARINADLNAALQSSDVKARLSNLGAEVRGGTPEAFGQFLQDEIAKWKKVAEAAKIQLERQD